MSILNITTVQTDIVWENKAANLAMFEKRISSLEEKLEVVILPEMFSTGFSMNPEIHAEKMDGTTLTWMKAITAAKKIILTGSVIIEEEGKYFNRLIWMLPNGQYGYYDKRHLFAYANEDKHYTAGSKRLIASVKGWKINLQVCYDLRFPVWSRQESAAEFDVLVYVANWPDRRRLAWKTLLRARAIENQCYVVGVNRIGEDGNNISYGGDSTIIDPLGEVLYEKAQEESIFTCGLRKEKLEEIRMKFPFWKDADHFFIEP
jgi:omega-amidase